MRLSGVQGRPYNSNVIDYLTQMLKAEQNVLKVQRILDDQGYHFSYPFLLGIAKKQNIQLKRGRPCSKMKS